MIDLDDPFITTDGSFGSVTLHLNVYLLTNPSPKWEDEVLVMVGKALNALRGSVEVGTFQLYDTVEINGSTRIFKGAVIKIAAQVALKEMI